MAGGGFIERVVVFGIGALLLALDRFMPAYPPARPALLPPRTRETPPPARDVPEDATPPEGRAPPPNAGAPKPIRVVPWNEGGEKTPNPRSLRFRRDVLDQLDKYMYYISRMKKSDPDTYELYSRVGGRILTQSVLMATGEIEPWFLSQMPAFGCVGIGICEDEKRARADDRIAPRFLYFTKYKRAPFAIQPANNGETYLLTAYFDISDEEKAEQGLSGKHGFGLQCAVSVARDGTITPLRVLLSEEQVVRHRSGPYRGSGTVIKHQRWGLPREFLKWVDEKHTTVPDIMRIVFRLAANGWAMSHAQMIRIGATKGKLTAAFGIDALTTPSFFKDRDEVLTETGKKARIFHIVRPHIRTLKDGRKIAIKLHFAGLQKFTWNGYQIHISVPGLEHADMFQFREGCLDEERELAEGRTADGCTDMKGLGEMVSDHVRLGYRQAQRMQQGRRA